MAENQHGSLPKGRAEVKLKVLLSTLPLLLPVCAAMAQDAPLYRLAGAHEDHLYTTSCQEIQDFTQHFGFHPEGIQASIWSQRGPGLRPLYRFYIAQNHDHFYTANQREVDSLVASGLRVELIAGFISPRPAPGLVPLYRLLVDGKNHFYTTNPRERRQVLGFASDEGIAGYVSPRASDPCQLGFQGTMAPPFYQRGQDYGPPQGPPPPPPPPGYQPQAPPPPGYQPQPQPGYQPPPPQSDRRQLYAVASTLLRFCAAA